MDNDELFKIVPYDSLIMNIAWSKMNKELDAREREEFNKWRTLLKKSVYIMKITQEQRDCKYADECAVEDLRLAKLLGILHQHISEIPVFNDGKIFKAELLKSLRLVDKNSNICDICGKKKTSPHKMIVLCECNR